MDPRAERALRCRAESPHAEQGAPMALLATIMATLLVLATMLAFGISV